MKQSTTRIGIDLAKNTFQVCAVDKLGRTQFNKSVSRAKLPAVIAQMPESEVIMEACAGAHYWARVFERAGHSIKLIHPAYARPFVQTNKNDAADALALCEAASRPNMRYVAGKTIDQQDIQSLHRIRDRLISQRTALSNQIRGLLGEYGVVLPQGIRAIRRLMPSVLEDATNELSYRSRLSFQFLYEELLALEERVTQITRDVEKISRDTERCQQWESIPGIGPMIATAMYATMGDPNNYRNGREFSAFLGLVPKQYSTGGKTILRGISKRGNAHTRRLLIQGAQAALRVMPRRNDALSRWACKLKASKGHCVAVVALANKLARICWATAQHNMTYQPNYAQ